MIHNDAAVDQSAGRSIREGSPTAQTSAPWIPA